MDLLEKLWNELLSRDPDLILKAFERINEEDKLNVLVHLKRMVTEDGWHPAQVESARAALDALKWRS
ncbi:MAG: hypothetical protein JXA19_02050 [Anaerolineales bacterium]|nr:hypothetical protein [Anaerolineales bacterium]